MEVQVLLYSVAMISIGLEENQVSVQLILTQPIITADVSE